MPVTAEVVAFNKPSAEVAAKRPFGIRGWRVLKVRRTRTTPL